MAKMSKQKLTAILVAVPLLIGAAALTMLRAPGTTVEGYGAPIGISGEDPGREYAAVLKNFPITIEGNSFTASELGISPAELPSIPRAWAIGDWGKNYTVPLKEDQAKRNSLLAKIEGYGAPLEATVSFDGDSWISTGSKPGLELAEDLPEAISKAFHEGKNSLGLKLQTFAPKVSTEAAQSIANRLNGASLELFGGSSKLATLDGAALAELISVGPGDKGLKLTVNSTVVEKLSETYSKSLAQAKVDGQQVVGDDGAVLKTIEDPRDGFAPATPDAIAQKLTPALAKLLDEPQGRVDLPGKVDPAKPKTLNRTALVDASDHYAYFYENGEEVARFPVAMGKPGYETDRGTFKVQSQLRSQDMGSCDAEGNYVPGHGADYCTAHVPWISYFNGDEGFHGTYWHNNFGNPTANMSHGCVNMRETDAEWVYRFLQIGSTVTVRD